MVPKCQRRDWSVDTSPPGSQVRNRVYSGGSGNRGCGKHTSGFVWKGVCFFSIAIAKGVGTHDQIGWKTATWHIVPKVLNYATKKRPLWDRGFRRNTIECFCFFHSTDTLSGHKTWNRHALVPTVRDTCSRTAMLQYSNISTIAGTAVRNSSTYSSSMQNATNTICNSMYSSMQYAANTMPGVQQYIQWYAVCSKYNTSEPQYNDRLYINT